MCYATMRRADRCSSRHVSTNLVRRELEQFAARYLDAAPYRIQIKDCYMPWSRMFEAGLSVSLAEDE
ncbi:DUF4127 family protein [Paenibacillus sp. DMB20]|uniref:DUF4127 family protein n=1 Tax=Paenibacillus sp. DMB20 TaxID=1642570 RepID=UPI00128D2BF4|nr:hypothetical protein [Paenibacillus sp. DMB20]